MQEVSPRLEALKKRLFGDDYVFKERLVKMYSQHVAQEQPKPPLRPRRLTRKVVHLDEYRLRKISRR